MAGGGDVCVVSAERVCGRGVDVYVVEEVGSDDVSRWYVAPQPRCSGRDVVMSSVLEFGGRTRTAMNFTIAICGEWGRYYHCPDYAYQRSDPPVEWHPEILVRHNC